MTPEKRRKFGWLIAKLALFVLVAWGVERAAVQAWSDLEGQDWHWSQVGWGWVALSAGLYLLGLLPAGLFWWQVLHRLGQTPTLYETLRAYYIGHLGKYVPGKTLVLVLRTGLICGPRVVPSVALASIFCETLTMMAVGAVVGGVLIAWRVHDQPWLLAAAIGMLLAAGLPTLPPVFRRLTRWAGAGRRDPEIVRQLDQLDYTTLARGWVGMFVGWCIVGGSLWAAVQATGLSSIRGHWLDEGIVAAGAAAAAVLAGFVSLLPGGLGVREFVLITLLAPTFGEGAALVATLLARFVWLVSELLVSGILYVIAPRPDGASPLGDAERPPT